MVYAACSHVQLVPSHPPPFPHPHHPPTTSVATRLPAPSQMQEDVLVGLGSAALTVGVASSTKVDPNFSSRDYSTVE